MDTEEGIALILFAIHISDGVLDPLWLIGGGLLLAILLFLSSRAIADEEIPRIGLLTAVFFVASLIHLRLGPTSVHLLLNGLVGMILRKRAVLALSVGLFLQAILLGHGGFTTIGINACILSIPALLAFPIYHWLARPPKQRQLTYRCEWLAGSYVLHPDLMLLAMLGFWLQKRFFGWKWQSQEFAAGFWTGFLVTLLTASLNSVALIVAGVEDWKLIATFSFLVHIPLAIVEGILLAFVVSFGSRVQPDWFERKGKIPTR